MFAQMILALLAFSSLTAASDPGCDQLIKPLEDRTKIYGKWILYAVAIDSKEHLNAVNYSKSSWVRNSPIPGSDEFTTNFMDKVDGRCVPGSVNPITVGNNIKVVYHYNNTSFENTGKYLETCPDCVLWMGETVGEVGGVPKEAKNLYLFTKAENLDASYMEVFKAQAKCLNLLMEFIFKETTDLCPEE